MIRVIVEHYLTPQGESQFDTWVDDVKCRASAYAGYISVTRAHDIRHPERTIIQLEWDDQESLDRWRASSDHHDVITASQHHRRAPMQAYFLQC